MLGSLKMAKLVGVWNHERWKSKKKMQVPLRVTSFKVVVPIVVEIINEFQEQINNPVPHNEVVNNKLMAAEQQEIALRRSQRQRRSVISDDYIVYLQES